MRRASALLCAALAGACASTACSSTAARELPPPSGSPTTVVVVIGSGARRALVAPYAARTPAVALRPDDLDEPLEILYFDEPLPWAAGTYDEATDLWGRALPAPTEAFGGTWSDDAWASLSPGMLRPFVFAQESPVLCVQRGGCFVDAGAIACTTPCPEPRAPLPPAAPLPPQYSPCPAGWSADAEAYTCRPFVGAAPDCALGLVRTPGGTCRAPGRACDGTWAAGLDDATTVFVQPGAVGGSGTRAAPLGTVAEALGRAGVRTIALAVGEHAAPARIAADVALIGACVAQTRLGAAAAIELGGGARLQDLETGELIVDGPTVQLTGVHVGGAITVQASASLELTDATVDGAITGAAGARLALLEARTHALELTDAAAVVALRSWIDGAITSVRTGVELTEVVVVGAVTAQEGRLSLARVVLSGSGASVPALTTRGVTALTTHQVLVAGGTGGVRLGAGTTATLEDTTFDQGPGAAEAISGDEVRLTVRRARFADGYAKDVRATNSIGPIVVEDVVTQQSAAIGLDLRGPSIAVRRGTLPGTTILQTAGLPVSLEAPPVIDVEDVSARGGIFRLRDDGYVRLQRAHLVAMRGTGLVADASPASPYMEVSDIVVEGTLATSDCPSRRCTQGSAIALEGGGLTLSRFWTHGNAGPGVVVQALQAPLHVHDGLIEGQRVGLGIEVPPTFMGQVLEGVRMVGVERICEPCGLDD